MDLRFLILGSTGFFKDKNVVSRSFFVGKMRYEQREKSKKIQSETSLFGLFSRGFTGFFREKIWLSQEVFERKCPFVARFCGETGFDSFELSWKL